jgi:hypothetical protein
MPHRRVLQPVSQSTTLLIRQTLTPRRRLHELPLGYLGIAPRQGLTPRSPARLIGRVARTLGMNAFVVSGLIKRRAELAGEIERAHKALHKMVLDLENLDATILQFEPDFRVETIKPKAFRPPKDWSNRGQMTLIVLSILRQAAEPLTSRDIALELLVGARLGQKRSAALAADDQTRRRGAPRAKAQRRGAIRSRAGAIHALGNRQIVVVI